MQQKLFFDKEKTIIIDFFSAKIKTTIKWNKQNKSCQLGGETTLNFYSDAILTF